MTDFGAREDKMKTVVGVTNVGLHTDFSHAIADLSCGGGAGGIL
jgi:hypothetical protein